MREDMIYDFCPKCSALMKNGVCQSCGYEKAETAGEEKQTERAPQENVNAENGDVRFQPPVKRQTGMIAALYAGGIICVILLCAAGYLIGKDVDARMKAASAAKEAALAENAEEKTEEESGENTDGGYFSRPPALYGKKKPDYQPSPEDSYYVTLVDAVDDTLSCRVDWREEKVEDEAGNPVFYSIYPQLSGEIPGIEELNSYIEERALYYRLFHESYSGLEGWESCSAESIGYVTYMDDEIVSIVFETGIHAGLATVPTLSDINIDLREGKVLEHGDILDYSAGLPEIFRTQNEAQNSTGIYRADCTDEMLLERLKGPAGVVFYTPVGLEAGYNYSGQEDGAYGWVTVTLKDYNSFEQMAGVWMIDFYLTDVSLWWGTGLSAGNGMEISRAGDFSYYIGAEIGGTGRLENKNGEITVEIQPYEDNGPENETLVLKYVNDDGAEHIVMNWHGENVCWKRENTQTESENTRTSEETLSSDAQEIKAVAEEFAAAYFSGDTGTIQRFLTTPYEWDAEVYTGTGTTGNITVKGLADIGNEENGSIKAVSLEYRDSEYGDAFQYLMLEFVKQDDGWKIQFYGLE